MMVNKVPKKKVMRKEFKGSRHHNSINQPYGFANKMKMMDENTAVTPYGDDKLIKEFGGCGGCPYFDTEECPHYPSVSSTSGKDGGPRYHSNGACSEFKKFLKRVTGEHYVGLTKQKQYVELVKDQMVKDRLFQEFKDDPKSIPPELLDWAKHIASSLSSIRKQEEGSKITHKRSISPMDIASFIDAEVKDVEVEEDD